MKKFLVTVLLIYIILLVGYHFYQTYELAAIGSLLLIPTTLILSIVNFRKLRVNKESHGLVLLSCLVLGISIIIAIGRIGLFTNYYNLGFLIVTSFFALIIGLLINKISFDTGIRVLIPLLVIYGIEVYQSNDFVTSSDFYRIDQLSHEILKSNSIIHYELRGFGPKTGDIILMNKVESSYANTIEAMDSYLQDVIAATGGYKYPETMSRVIDPKRKVPTELIELWIPRIRNSILNDINNEKNEDKKEILSLIKSQFDHDVFNDNVLESRIRVYSAQNKLFAMSLIE